MQNRYVGDIGDYGKFGLLRRLSVGLRLGVAWYLFPDEKHNADGRHVAYLDQPDKWEHHDPELFAGLRRIVKGGERHIASIEKSGLLPDAVFASEVLDPGSLSVAGRRTWRADWFDRVSALMAECDIVFADPDNGLCQDEKFRPGRHKDWKRLPLCEAAALSEGRTAVLYHHNTHRKGGHRLEIEHWIGKLPGRTLALRWRAYNARTFFVVNPTTKIEARLRMFAEEWKPKAELLDLNARD